MSDKIDFIQAVDCIFKNKQNYKKLTDDDKIDNFFMINRKFAIKYYKVAEFFNNKYVDKASSLDLWFNYFQNNIGIPGWYWAKSTTIKEKDYKIPKADKELFMKNEKIDEKEFDFLITNFRDDVIYEIKKLKKFE